MLSIRSVSRSWQITLGAICLLVAWILTGYWSTFSAMAGIWLRSDTYQHGLLVPPITAWLIWRRRQNLGALTPHPASYLILLPIALLVSSWLIGELTAVNALTQFSVVGLIVSLIFAMVGPQVGKQLAFPLCFLFFAVPIGDFLMPQLMDWTANFTILALKATGIPVYREGLQFVIPSGNWSVVEACSGIRYLISSLTVGTLFAYLTYTSFTRRLAFVTVSLLVPIIANWLRAYLIVLLGHLSGNKLAAGADHLIYGWVFFGLVIAIMFAIGMRWSEPEAAEKVPVSVSAEEKEPFQQKHYLPMLLLCVLLTLSGPLIHQHLRSGIADTPVSLNLTTNKDWISAEKTLTNWQPAYANPSAEIQKTFEHNGQLVGIYVGYYRHQDYARKLISSTNLLVTYKDKNWLTANQTTTTLNTGHGSIQTRQADVLAMRDSQEQRLRVHYWYWVNGKTTTSDVMGKLLTVLSQLSGHGDDSAVIMVYAPVDNAEASIDLFMQAHFDSISKMLDQAVQRTPR